MIMGVVICLLLSACQMDDAGSIAPEQSVWRKETLDCDNEYHCAIDAYSALLRGEAGLDGNMSHTIASNPDTKYTMIDMNDDGIPELAVTTVIFQDHSPDTSELESTALDSAIFSYKDGEVFLWDGGDHRHNYFEILSNRALLYDSDDGHGGREIIYQELDKNGDIAHEIELWNSSDGRYYFIDYTQSVPQVEISEEEWHEIADPILALRTDVIPWASCPMKSDDSDSLSMSKALELVRAYIGHKGSYAPLQQNISGETMVIGDVYAVMASESQISSVCLYNYIYPQNALNAEWFFFHLETYFIDDIETGDWHTSSLNDFAVNKNTGKIIARLTTDGSPNQAICLLEENCTNINVIGETVVFRVVTTGKGVEAGYYMMGFDGSGFSP